MESVADGFRPALQPPALLAWCPSRCPPSCLSALRPTCLQFLFCVVHDSEWPSILLRIHARFAMSCLSVIASNRPQKARLSEVFEQSQSAWIALFL